MLQIYKFIDKLHNNNKIVLLICICHILFAPFIYLQNL